MISEIADSDAESDIDPPPSESHCLDTAQSTGPGPPFQFDFEQFLSPTQKLSSISTSQDEFLRRGTGSTERILREIADARKYLAGSSSDLVPSSGVDGETHIMANKKLSKRRHTDIDGSHMDRDERSGGTKRPKTYGSRSKHLSEIDLFPDVPTDPEPTSPSGPDIMPTAETIMTGRAVSDSTPRQRDRPRRVVSLLGQSTSPYRQISTTTASMGNYQSLNLDFRGQQHDLDVHANPFATLSQLSLEGDPDTPEALKLANIFQVDDPHSSERPHESEEKRPLNNSEGVENALGKWMDNGVPTDEKPAAETNATNSNRTSPRHLKNSRAANETSQPANEIISPASRSSRRAVSILSDTVAQSTETSKSRKRGRKSKNSRISQSPAPSVQRSVQDEHITDPDALDTSVEDQLRQDALDTVSQISQNSELPTTRKRKRRDSTGPKSLMLPPPDPVQHESSPVKNPTSDLNLSDEALIGLPKENYKPRPSRSRSKRTNDEEDDVVADSNKTISSVEETVTPAKQPPTKPTKKSGRKSKVKRAKTSAAALLRKSEHMLSEGEDDVLWLDEKPAPVKLELPPDLETLKKEEEPDPECDKTLDAKAKEEIRNDSERQPSRTNAFSIEIPPPTETQSPEPPPQKPPEPKKRGRKPKQQPQPTDVDSDIDPLADAETTLTDNLRRQPLTNKDPNTNSPTDPSNLKSTTSTPPKLTIPIPDQENTPSTSPQKGPSPTTHSPIKPPLLPGSSGRFKYRVGLSRRQNIPSLLRKVDKAKEPPRVVARKEKENKKKVVNDDDEEGGGGIKDRDADGNLIEWEF